MSTTSTAVPPTVSWLAHLRRETERFADVVRESPLLAYVPAYSDFTVQSLAAHAPIPADLAVQEVESEFTNFVPRLASSGAADIGGTVSLRATDTLAAWSAQVSDGRLVTEREPDDPSTATVVVTGAAEDIALLVWKRALPPRPELDVAGSTEVLKRFLVTDYIPDPRTTPAH